MKLHLDRQATLSALLAQEDTDGSKTITIEDNGPKHFVVKDRHGQMLDVKGTYQLANLLQELWLSKDGILDSDLVTQKALARIDHLIRHHYWKTLTRRIDEAGLLATLADEKRSSDKQYLYVPEADPDSLAFYRQITAAHPNIEVLTVPPTLTPAYLESIEDRPGLLALKIDPNTHQPAPYVVPGGRFNEMYGWDSYFIGLGLIAHDQYELAHAGKHGLPDPALRPHAQCQPQLLPEPFAAAVLHPVPARLSRRIR